MKKILLGLFVFLMVFEIFGATVFADTVSEPGATVLPATEFSTTTCQKVMDLVVRSPKEFKQEIADRNDNIEISIPGNAENYNYTDILACGIKTGNIPLWMVPFYLRWVLEFIIGLAGLASVVGLIVGGYMYLFSGLSQDKEKGKNALKNAAIGLVLTLTAWAIVNIILSVVTG